MDNLLVKCVGGVYQISGSHPLVFIHINLFLDDLIATRSTNHYHIYMCLSNNSLFVSSRTFSLKIQLWASSFSAPILASFTSYLNSYIALGEEVSLKLFDTARKIDVIDIATNRTWRTARVSLGPAYQIGGQRLAMPNDGTRGAEDLSLG